jgi:HipA-like protein
VNKLVVELYGSVLGALSQNHGRFSFEVDPAVFHKYSASSTIMSLSVPLNLHYTSLQKRRADVFFSELLPEGRNYEWMLKYLPRGEQTPFGMLRKYGRDIVGALLIYDQVPLSHLNTDGRMALAVNGKYLHADISLADIAAELISWRCHRFCDEHETVFFIKEKIAYYRDIMSNAIIDKKAYTNLKIDISSIISRLLSGKNIGDL